MLAGKVRPVIAPNGSISANNSPSGTRHTVIKRAEHILSNIDGAALKKAESVFSQAFCDCTIF